MEITIGSRVKNAWNAFMGRDPTSYYYGNSHYSRPDRIRLSRGNERSIVTSIFNRIALDAASVDIVHCKVDDEGRFLELINSTLNNCLTLEANKDQISNAFIQDVVMSMLDEGSVAIVPVDTVGNPMKTDSYDILTMRTAKILEWYPDHVKVRIYNDNTGNKEDMILPKSMVAIIENPLYSVINEPNSTMQRLIHKLNLLDIIDDNNSSGKLDLIFQLPYSIRSQAKKKQAEARLQDIENQLVGSRHGITYIDATEKVTQLNRSVENTLFSQVEYFTSMLYSQLGMTQSILDGTADEATMLNYFSRTIVPIVTAIAKEIKRKFLTKKEISEKQSIECFKDPFSFVPVGQIAEIADKFTRNEITTSNEIRQAIGMKPSRDPNADILRNKNLSAPSGSEPIPTVSKINNDDTRRKNQNEN